MFVEPTLSTSPHANITDNIVVYRRTNDTDAFILYGEKISSRYCNKYLHGSWPTSIPVYSRFYRHIHFFKCRFAVPRRVTIFNLGVISFIYFIFFFYRCTPSFRYKSGQLPISGYFSRVLRACSYRCTLTNRAKARAHSG